MWVSALLACTLILDKFLNQRQAVDNWELVPSLSTAFSINGKSDFKNHPIACYKSLQTGTVMRVMVTGWSTRFQQLHCFR